ncbi:putative protein [Aquifex aeolicus VF5]|uniref:Uncharacterized protein aq_1959 n=2 Tax=Aquifex aeolicus TaxID=63363 RepID=Y1959_AQUAE|nr:RecName: Full=Uncharacterized protein aq_1959; Flags: Precursor [Aquifex aeolicus VF5]AAC07742.1 putative protein [Aquifex aeolicus VF5]
MVIGRKAGIIIYVMHALLLLLLSFTFALEPLSEWWSKAKEVCLYGKYKNYDGTLRDIKPFCCKVERVEVEPIKGLLKGKFGLKESLKVIASCNGAFYGVMSYDGTILAVGGKKGIVKETPSGVMEVEDEKTIHFVVCRSGASLEGCYGEVFAEGYIIKKK